MLVGTVLGAVSFVCSLFVSPETKGKVLVPDLLLASRGPGKPISIADEISNCGIDRVTDARPGLFLFADTDFVWSAVPM
jgi:hypothetical protein